MKYVTLYNGLKMPVLRYGVYQVTKYECRKTHDSSKEKKSW